MHSVLGKCMEELRCIFAACKNLIFLDSCLASHYHTRKVALTYAKTRENRIRRRNSGLSGER